MPRSRGIVGNIRRLGRTLNTVSDVLPMLERLDKGAEFVINGRKALSGDLGGLAYFATGGWAEPLDIWRPGTASHARGALSTTVDAWGDVWRDLTGQPKPKQIRAEREPPWSPFLRFKLAQKSGANIIVGKEGSGKTELMKKFTVAQSLKLGYQLEFCNLHYEDFPYGYPAVAIDTDVLVQRLEKLQKALKALVQLGIVNAEAMKEPPGDASVHPGPQTIEPVSPLDDPRVEKILDDHLPFRRRIIGIDEMGLLDDNPQGREYKAIIRALTQSRHLKWQIWYCGQTFSQFPRSLLSRSTVLIKEPTGREADFDRQLPWVRATWREAHASFQKVRDLPEWSDYPHREAWAHVSASSATGLKAGYTGLMPFDRLPSKAA